MITVHICGEEKTLQEVDTDWITRVLNRNRIQENSICVKVDVNGNSTDLKLATPNCDDFAPAKGKNEIEKRIIFLWEEMVLSKKDIFATQIYDFLTRMEQWASFVPKKVL
ncbi:MAG: hypothetical protein WD059_01455 [Balneolaceae bacterium]